MALLRYGIDFTGRLGDITAYRMKGNPRTILRRCGGVSAERIRTDPKFGTVRLNGCEFGGRGKATSVFVKMLHPHKEQSDYSYGSEINSRMKRLQDLDKEHPLGQRSILFSRYPEFWNGFSLNAVRTFDNAVIAPVLCTIARETLSAQVEIPELVPQVNLAAKEWQSLFRIQAVLGVLPDLFYQNEHVGYVPTIPKETIAPVQQFTPWMSCWNKSPATVLKLELPALPVQEGFALMVSVGLCFGQPLSADGRDVLELRTGGAAKILRVM
jgi:hypothetical protein